MQISTNKRDPPDKKEISLPKNKTLSSYEQEKNSKLSNVVWIRPKKIMTVHRFDWKSRRMELIAGDVSKGRNILKKFKRKTPCNKKRSRYEHEDISINKNSLRSSWAVEKTNPDSADNLKLTLTKQVEVAKAPKKRGRPPKKKDCTCRRHAKEDKISQESILSCRPFKRKSAKIRSRRRKEKKYKIEKSIENFQRVLVSNFQDILNTANDERFDPSSNNLSDSKRSSWCLSQSRSELQYRLRGLQITNKLVDGIGLNFQSDSKFISNVDLTKAISTNESGERFETLQFLQEDIQTYVDSVAYNVFICRSCGKRFLKENNLEIHKKICEKFVPDSIFDSDNSMKHNIIEKVFVFPCNFCNVLFKYAMEKRKHESTCQKSLKRQLILSDWPESYIKTPRRECAEIELKNSQPRYLTAIEIDSNKESQIHSSTDLTPYSLQKPKLNEGIKQNSNEKGAGKNGVGINTQLTAVNLENREVSFTETYKNSRISDMTETEDSSLEMPVLVAVSDLPLKYSENEFCVNRKIKGFDEEIQPVKEVNLKITGKKTKSFEKLKRNAYKTSNLAKKNVNIEEKNVNKEEKNINKAEIKINQGEKKKNQEEKKRNQEEKKINQEEKKRNQEEKKRNQEEKKIHQEKKERNKEEKYPDLTEIPIINILVSSDDEDEIIVLDDNYIKKKCEKQPFILTNSPAELQTSFIKPKEQRLKLINRINEANEFCNIIQLPEIMSRRTLENEDLNKISKISETNISPSFTNDNSDTTFMGIIPNNSALPSTVLRNQDDILSDDNDQNIHLDFNNKQKINSIQTQSSSTKRLKQRTVRHESSNKISNSVDDQRFNSDFNDTEDVRILGEYLTNRAKTYVKDQIQKEYACFECEGVFGTKSEFREHHFKEHGTKRVLHETPNPYFICGICDCGFKEEKSLLRHVEIHRKDNLNTK